MELYSPQTIRYIKEKYGFKISKSLGQNFITDRNIIEKIIEGSGAGPEDLVIEIGPGIGVLTAEAAEAAAYVVAIEIDRNLLQVLDETLAGYGNIQIINRDVLETDINGIIAEQRKAGSFSGGVHLIGNLPYYITTPIIMKILESGVNAESITVMMQKEVADRICSPAGSKAYGTISVAVQYYCDVKKIASVSKDVFVPRPKVDSTVLRMTPLKEKRIKTVDEKMFFFCVKAAFAQRRKTLANSLANAGGIEKDRVISILERAGIDPVRRAETLSIEEFGKLADEMANEAGSRNNG